MSVEPINPEFQDKLICLALTYGYSEGAFIIHPGMGTAIVTARTRYELSAGGTGLNPPGAIKAEGDMANLGREMLKDFPQVTSADAFTPISRCGREELERMLRSGKPPAQVAGETGYSPEYVRTISVDLRLHWPLGRPRSNIP